MEKSIKISGVEGSIMIEAAIIFPLVLLVLFGLLSGILVLHDRFVTEMTLEIYGIGLTKEDVYNEINKKRIAGTDELTFNPETTETSGQWKIPVSDETNYPLSGLYPFKKTYDVAYQKPKSLECILAVELINDMIDSITFPESMKQNYDSFIKKIFGALEFY